MSDVDILRFYRDASDHCLYNIRTKHTVTVSLHTHESDSFFSGVLCQHMGTGLVGEAVALSQKCNHNNNTMFTNDY